MLVQGSIPPTPANGESLTQTPFQTSPPFQHTPTEHAVSEATTLASNPVPSKRHTHVRVQKQKTPPLPRLPLLLLPQTSQLASISSVTSGVFPLPPYTYELPSSIHFKASHVLLWPSFQTAIRAAARRLKQGAQTDGRSREMEGEGA